MKSPSKKSPAIINSISELHRILKLPKPLHPLISLVNYSDVKEVPDEFRTSLIMNFYKISFKENKHGKIKYGQNYYDFDEGGLVFVSPNQLIASAGGEQEYAGYSLLIHPDFIRNYSLGKDIKKFGFFSYSTNESLHLSEKERQTILSVFQNIQQEITSTIDEFSQDVMIAHIEVLLNYSNRFYKRQFITRKAVNNDLLEKLETLLEDYFNNETALIKGLPTVHFLAEQVNVSPRYLSDMLRTLTAQSAQQHIHNKLIEKAKEILSTSNLSIAEVAYQLGFEHPQSFNKIFKRKTNLTPVEFKQSFN
jgi:AraC family transcriptional activator of pobA